MAPASPPTASGADLMQGCQAILIGQVRADPALEELANFFQVIPGSRLKEGDAGREEHPFLRPAAGPPALRLLLSPGPHLHLLGPSLLGVLEPFLCAHPAHHGHLCQQFQVLGHGGGCLPRGLRGAPARAAQGPGWA